MREDYSDMEMMAIACARRITNQDVVFCGTGLPLLAAMTAKMTHAPHCVVFFETGALDPQLEELPLSVADSRVMQGASHLGGLADAFAFMQNRFTGPRVVGILSGAQIDAYGNLNSTVIGDYECPTVRLPGSGGACDVASFVGHTFVFMRHERRRFVERLDYVTSPGWLDGGDSRQRRGLPRGGPEAVFTTLGVMRFDPQTRRMYLSTYYENSSPEEVQDNTGFEIEVKDAKVEKPPTDDELNVLRTKVDPLHLILQ
ncbi:MAG: CoA-transferase subunit beta [Candidatus Thorarchaeota archaeon]